MFKFMYKLYFYLFGMINKNIFFLYYCIYNEWTTL
jgi:hypothetical protein